MQAEDIIMAIQGNHRIGIGDGGHHVKGNRLDNRREKLECIDHCVHALMFIGPEAKAYAEHVKFHQEPEPVYDYDSIPF